MQPFWIAQNCFKRTICYAFKMRCHKVGLQLNNPYLQWGSETLTYVKKYFGLPQQHISKRVCKL